jgi:hypothetical protein
LATVWSYFPPTTSSEAPVEGVNVFIGELVCILSVYTLSNNDYMQGNKQSCGTRSITI